MFFGSLYWKQYKPISDCRFMVLPSKVKLEFGESDVWRLEKKFATMLLHFVITFNFDMQHDYVLKKFKLDLLKTSPRAVCVCV